MPERPPPGLYGAHHPDLFTRLAGFGVSQLASVVVGLGGDKELPELPTAVDRWAVRIVHRRQVARDADVVALTLADPGGAALPRWHPGAHIALYLPSGRVRQYSLCGEPDRLSEYRIAVRRIPDGGGGSVEVQGLEVGQMVEISAPRNAFMMPLPGSGSRADQLLFIAGGIGITPILPMAALAERLGLRWSMRYVGRHRDSMPFLDELLPFGDKVQVRTDDEHGLATAADLLAGVGEGTAVYVCGPPPLIRMVRAGVPTSNELHVERFSPLPVVDGMPFELQLARSGEVMQVGADQTALAVLRAARPNVSFSCQQGFCGTCVQLVLNGDIEHRDIKLTDEQREHGQMLVCVSRAKSCGGRLVLDC